MNKFTHIIGIGIDTSRREIAQTADFSELTIPEPEVRPIGDLGKEVIAAMLDELTQAEDGVDHARAA